MSLYVHLLVGVLLGLSLKNKLLIVISSLVSHILLDIFQFPPKEYTIFHHKNKNFLEYIKKDRGILKLIKMTYPTFLLRSFEVLFSICIIGLIFIKGFLSNENVLIGMFFSSILDFINLIPLIFTGKFPDHHKFSIKINPYLTLFVHQILTLALFLFVLFR